MLMIENLAPIDFGEVRCLILIMFTTFLFLALVCEVRSNSIACLVTITIILFGEHSILYDEEWSVIMVFQKVIAIVACLVSLLVSGMIVTHVVINQAEMQINL